MEDCSIQLEATASALEKLADLGYDPDMGARPLRRVIQQQVEDQLSDALLAGEFEGCNTVIVDVDEDEDEIVLRTVEDESASSPEAEVIAAG